MTAFWNYNQNCEERCPISLLFCPKTCFIARSRSLYFTDKGRVKAAEARAKKAAKKAFAEKRSGLLKHDSAFQSETRGRKQKQADAAENEGYASSLSIKYVSYHGGNGDSPYPSEWEGNSQHSVPATPEFQREESSGQNPQQVMPITPMPQLSLTSNLLPQTFMGPSTNIGTRNIR